MTGNGLVQIGALPRRPARAREAARRATWRASTTGEPTCLDRGAAARSSGSSTGSAASARTRSMTWKRYAVAMLALQRRSASLVVYALQRLQGVLPLNPAGLRRRDARLVVQHRGQLRHQHELAGLRRRDDDELPDADARARRCRTSSRPRPAWRCWSRCIRGFARAQRADDRQLLGRPRRARRSTSCCRCRSSLALVLVSQGVVQTLRRLPRPSHAASSRRPDADGNAGDRAGARRSGPAASQIAIKQLGTNGGGFFNVNSAHPFENPTPLSNFLEMLAILLIPAALCYTFGAMVGDTPPGLGAARRDDRRSSSPCSRSASWAEQARQPARSRRSASTSAPATLQPGGNMEGKEVRFGIADSALWATATTAASNGSVNSMHDSFTPLGGLVPMFTDPARRGDLRRRRLGPLRHAGVRDRRGLRRRPDGRPHAGVPRQEDRGLRDEDGLARDPDPAASSCSAARRSPSCRRRASPGVANPGPHGFSEILYAFTLDGEQQRQRLRRPRREHALLQRASAASRCSSRRYWLAIPTLAIAGSLARKKLVPPAPARCRRTRRCSSCCWSASCSSSAR